MKDEKHKHWARQAARYFGDRLLEQYRSENNEMMVSIIQPARITVSDIKRSVYDGPHLECRMFLPRGTMSQIPFDKDEEYQTALLERLRKVNKIRDIEWASLILDIFYDDNPECEHAIPVDSNYSEMAHSFAETDMPDCWKGGGDIKIFMSHLAAQKGEAAKLATELPKEFSYFIAHKDIEVTKEWQVEIKKALMSANAFVLFVRQGVEKSYWINQEIGAAVARGIPIVSLKMDGKNPCGFSGGIQAQEVPQPVNFVRLADEVTNILLKKFPRWKGKIQSPLRRNTIEKFIQSGSWDSAKANFEELQKLKNITYEEAESLMQAWHANVDIKQAFGVGTNGELQGFLRRAGDGSYTIENDQCIKSGSSEELSKDLDDEVPF